MANRKALNNGNKLVGRHFDLNCLSSKTLECFMENLLPWILELKAKESLLVTFQWGCMVFLSLIGAFPAIAIVLTVADRVFS